MLFEPSEANGTFPSPHLALRTLHEMSCLTSFRRSDSAERRVLREVMERKKIMARGENPHSHSHPPARANFPDISLRGFNNLNFWTRLCSVRLRSWSAFREAILNGSLTHCKNAFFRGRLKKSDKTIAIKIKTVMLRFIFCQRRVRKKS